MQLSCIGEFGFKYEKEFLNLLTNNYW